MKDEFIKLYLDWHYSYSFSAVYMPLNDKIVPLEQWCLNHKEEAIQYITELLLEEPNDIIIILPKLTGKDFNLGAEGIYWSLDALCNLWLNYLLKPKKTTDYYVDYRKWKKYLEKHYMGWRPNLENDPNITLEEFKQGKRNKESNRSWHDFPLAILKDEELERLYKDGHLGDMTKYIKELHFFYNQVEEEIKRRKLKKH